jgi:hypothetical protein
VVVRYARAQVDDFIDIADAIEEQYPHVVVEGVEDDNDTESMIQVTVDDRPIVHVSSTPAPDDNHHRHARILQALDFLKK